MKRLKPSKLKVTNALSFILFPLLFSCSEEIQHLESDHLVVTQEIVEASAMPVGPFTVGAVELLSITDSKATVQFTTSANSKAYIDYGRDSNYGEQNTGNFTFDYATHRQNISNLDPGTTYFYKIVTINKGGEQATASGTFTTAENGNGTNTRPFTVEGLEVINLEDNQVRIRFTASANAQAYIEYGTDTDYGSRSKKQESFNYATHIQRIRELESGATYYYRVRVNNESGQTASATGRFTYDIPTGEGTKDSIGFGFEFEVKPEVIEISDNNVKITFTTTEFSQAYIDFGETRNFGLKSNPQLSFDYREHIQKLPNPKDTSAISLMADTDYFYQVTVTNQSGSTIKSQVLQFTTNKSTDADTSTTSLFYNLPDSFDQLQEKNNFTSMWSHPTLGVDENLISGQRNKIKNGVYPVRRLSIGNSPDGRRSLIHTVNKPQQIEPVGIDLKTVERDPLLDYGYAIRFQFYSTGYSALPGKVIELEGGRGWVSNRYRRGTEYGETGWGVNLMRPTRSGKNYFRILGSYGDQRSSYGDTFTGSTTPYALHQWHDIVLMTYFNKQSPTNGKYVIYVDNQKYLETEEVNLLQDGKNLAQTSAVHVFLRLMDGGNPDQMINDGNSYREYFRDITLFRIN